MKVAIILLRGRLNDRNEKDVGCWVGVVIVQGGVAGVAGWIGYCCIVLPVFWESGLVAGRI